MIRLAGSRTSASRKDRLRRTLGPSKGFRSSHPLLPSFTWRTRLYGACDNPVWPTLIFRFELDSFVRTAQITEVQGEAFNDYVCCLHGVYMRLFRQINIFAREKTLINSNSYGAPCGIRTHGPRIRNPVLYPSELRGHASKYKAFFGLDRLSRATLTAILTATGLRIGLFSFYVRVK